MDGRLFALRNTQDILDDVFPRSDARDTAEAYIEALIGNSARKTCWQMSEAAGHQSPYRFQHLLGRAAWDAEKLRIHVARKVVHSLGNENVVLSVDETGFLKKGRHSAGVGRQYSGTAGRIENCQVGVFLNYSTDKGHALLDRALYLPKDWADDATRLRSVGVPFKGAFRTKQHRHLSPICRQSTRRPVLPCLLQIRHLRGTDHQRSWMALDNRGRLRSHQRGTRPRPL